MSIDARIIDTETGKHVRVVGGNALAVNPPYPSLSFNATLGTDDTVVNVVPAKADYVFCLTALLFTGNKNINTNVDATVQVYIGASETTTAANADRALITVPVAQSSSRDITGILLETTEGKWINAVTSDDDVFVTALGYYIKVEG